MHSPSLARAARKLEDLPSDGGAAVDTLAGAQLRTFMRLNELEAALARVAWRVAALEGSGAAEDGVLGNGPDGFLFKAADAPFRWDGKTPPGSCRSPKRLR